MIFYEKSLKLVFIYIKFKYYFDHWYLFLLRVMIKMDFVIFGVTKFITFSLYTLWWYRSTKTSDGDARKMAGSVEENLEVTTSLRTLLINPGNKITTVKLTDYNFLLWKFLVLAALQGNGSESYIDETSKIPQQYITSIEH